MNRFWDNTNWARMTPAQQVLAMFLRASALGLAWNSQAAQTLCKQAGINDAALVAFNKDLAIAHAVVS
jgi:hypothetical protein